MATTTAPKPAPPSLPPPLCRFKENRAQFIANKVILLAMALIFAYFGTLIVAALYYLLFQTTDAMNNWWHQTVPNSMVRHAIRDVGEGLLGGLLAQHIVMNRYKYLDKPRDKNWLDRLEIKLHIANVKDNKRLSIGQLLATPVLVLVYAQPGFWAALGLIQLFHHNDGLRGFLDHAFAWAKDWKISQSAEHQTYVSKVQASVTDALPNKITGFAAAFVFGRRPFKGVSQDVQLWLCEQRYLRLQHNVGKYQWYYHFVPGFIKRRMRPMNVMHGSPLWYPPTWRACYKSTSEGQIDAKYHEVLAVGIVPLLWMLSVALTIYGWYVVTIIANR